MKHLSFTKVLWTRVCYNVSISAFTCIYMCVFVYVDIGLYVVSHACTYIYMCIHVYLYICIYVCLCTCLQALTCACTHLYMSTHAFYTLAHVFTHKYMFTHISVFVCMFACVYTCMLTVNLSSRGENTGVLADPWPLPHSLCHTLPLGSVFCKAICHPSWPRLTEAVTVTSDLWCLQCLSGSDSSLGTSWLHRKIVGIQLEWDTAFKTVWFPHFFFKPLPDINAFRV